MWYWVVAPRKWSGITSNLRMFFNYFFDLNIFWDHYPGWRRQPMDKNSLGSFLFSFSIKSNFKTDMLIFHIFWWDETYLMFWKSCPYSGVLIWAMTLLRPWTFLLFYTCVWPIKSQTLGYMGMIVMEVHRSDLLPQNLMQWLTLNLPSITSKAMFSPRWSLLTSAKQNC